MFFLEYVKAKNIDVVLLDIQMPMLNGFEVCKQLKIINSEIKILIISQLTSKEVIHHVMECGADGFCSKNSSSEHLEIAIRKIMEHDYYFDNELGSVIRDAILWDKNEGQSYYFTKSISLTEREIDIIKMACAEYSSKEIANKLFISTRTVENHRKRIMEKTQAKNFIGVILYTLKINAINIEDFD